MVQSMYLSFTDLIMKVTNLFFFSFFLETHLKAVFKIIAFLIHITRYETMCGQYAIDYFAR